LTGQTEAILQVRVTGEAVITGEGAIVPIE